MSYAWNTAKYISEVENTADKGLREYQQVELDFVRSVDNLSIKTIVDVGAGYGRVLPMLAPLAKSYLSVEQDQNELKELQLRSQRYPSCSVIVGSGNDLTKLLPKTIKNPLLLSLQNTLGPWQGDRTEAIAQLAKVAKGASGEVIVSLFCQEALADWGIAMYATAAGLVGNYDGSLSDIENGIFRTDTGYESHWFSPNEREQIKQLLGGNLVRETLDHKFHIFQMTYDTVVN